ncbi:MAG: hydrolase 1, exosortase A system-associated [Pseudomonadota bacterium]
MRFSEEALSFTCAGDRLVGILARPACPAQTGVVVVVGGPQYRVGSHRQFVHLSRELAAAGYPVLRFDVRGMGDSEGEPLDFEGTAADIAQAVNTLQHSVPTVDSVALWGLCDGASAALLYCLDTLDTRVGALCLVNPWVRNEESLARTRVKHYYLQRLLRADFWAKLLRGGIRFEVLGEWGHSVWLAMRGQREAAGQSTFQQRMASAWDAFSGRIFLLLSEDDYVAKEFLEHAARDAAWKNALQHPRLVRHDEPGADHTFSSAALHARVAALTLQHSLRHWPE